MALINDCLGLDARGAGGVSCLEAKPGRLLLPGLTLSLNTVAISDADHTFCQRPARMSGVMTGLRITESVSSRDLTPNSIYML